MKEIYEYTVEDEIATNFVMDIIINAMQQFSITYAQVVEVLKQLRYWDMFNDTDVTVTGAHEGIEPVLKEIKGAL